MQIEFEDERVRLLFEDLGNVHRHQGLMKKTIGNELTRAVKKRYDSLNASDNFYIFLSTGLGKPHSLVGDLYGCYGVHVDAKYRLVIRPICADLSPESLKLCTVIIIKGVVNYHGTKSNWLIP